MFPAIDPKQLAQFQELSKNITAKITVNYPEGSVLLILSTQDPKASQLIPKLLEQFAQGLAVQMSSFMAIQGEIIEVGKPQ